MEKADIIEPDGTTYLCYTSMKTNDLIDVWLDPKAKVMIKRYMASVNGLYLLPWLSKFTELPTLTDEQNRHRVIRQIKSKTMIINTKLKEIAKLLGWETNLSTHIARHTFATLANQKVTDKPKLSSALGYARFTTTEVYLADLRSIDVNDAVDEVWK